MDALIVAQMRHATLVGSKSTRQISWGFGSPTVPFLLADSPLIAGDFTITFFNAHHAPYQFEDEKGRRHDQFDWFRAWLERTLAGTILVVPSAKTPLELGDAQADVVLLGIGDLDKFSKDDIRTYWKAAVENTHARLVIPIHWDNFFRSLKHTLEPFPAFVDDVACAMETLTYLNSHKVAIRFMASFKTVPLDAATANTLGEHEQSVQWPSEPDPFKDGCRAGRGSRAVVGFDSTHNGLSSFGSPECRTSNLARLSLLVWTNGTVKFAASDQAASSSDHARADTPGVFATQ